MACAAGRAVLQVIDAEGLQANARIVGRALRGVLERLQARHPIIGQVRGPDSGARKPWHQSPQGRNAVRSPADEHELEASRGLGRLQQRGHVAQGLGAVSHDRHAIRVVGGNADQHVVGERLRVEFPVDHERENEALECAIVGFGKSGEAVQQSSVALSNGGPRCPHGRCLLDKGSGQ